MKVRAEKGLMLQKPRVQRSPLTHQEAARRGPEQSPHSPHQHGVQPQPYPALWPQVCLGLHLLWFLFSGGLLSSWRKGLLSVGFLLCL